MNQDQISAQPQQQRFRLLHTMLRCKNMDDSIAFYTEQLGMSLLRKKDYPDGQFTLAFLGYGSEEKNTVLELTYNWESQENTTGYDKGRAFGHIALGVQGIYNVCQRLEQNGVKIARQPGPMKADASELIAFIEDPDGYQIELIEKP